MSYSDLYTPNFKKRNKGHYASIVRVALADGVISEQEKKMLKRLAINLEIEEEEVNEIMKNPESFPINPPPTGLKRAERLYDLTKMVLADDLVDTDEIKILEKLIIGLGYKKENVEEIENKAIELIKNNVSDDDFIEKFKHI